MKRIMTLLMVVALVITGCGSKENISTEKEGESYTSVEVETLKSMGLYIENIMTAKTFADKDVYVMPMISGKVERINVNVGDRVNKDDLLFVMNKEDIDKQVKQSFAAYEAAKAGYDVSASQIESAKKSYERIKKLYEEGVVPESQYDQAKLAASDVALEASQKNVEQARVAYENVASTAKNAQVKSPISGVVSDISIVEGEYTSPSKPPITIVDADSITIELGVPGNMVNKIKQGDKVTAEISDADYKAESVVDSISTSADAMTNLYTVNIVLENNGKIKPGMFAKIYFNTDKIENALAVRTEAVVEKDSKKYVYIANGESALLKEVVTGLDTGTYIEIKKGLALGDKVIIKGQEYLNDGTKIKIVRGE